MSSNTQSNSLWDELAETVVKSASQPSIEEVEEAFEKKTGRKLQEILG